MNKQKRSKLTVKKREWTCNHSLEWKSWWWQGVKLYSLIKQGSSSNFWLGNTNFYWVTQSFNFLLGNTTLQFQLYTCIIIMCLWIKWLSETKKELLNLCVVLSCVLWIEKNILKSLCFIFIKFNTSIMY